MTTTVAGDPTDTGCGRPGRSLPPVPDGAVMLTVHIQRYNPELDDAAAHASPTGCRRCPATGC